MWGYEVEHQRLKLQTNRNTNRLMDRPKLMLVESKYTRADRKRLGPRINRLIGSEVVHRRGQSDELGHQDMEDIIGEFLVRVFQHTKQQLEENEGFADDSVVEWVKTVPAIWSPSASRVMEKAMATAIQTTGLGTLSHGCIDNLFVTSEPDVAGTYLMRCAGNLSVKLFYSTFHLLFLTNTGRVYHWRAW